MNENKVHSEEDFEEIVREDIINNMKHLENNSNNNSEDSKDCVHQNKDPESIARLSPAVNSGSNHSSHSVSGVANPESKATAREDKDPDDLVKFLPGKPSDSGSDIPLSDIK